MASYRQGFNSTFAFIAVQLPGYTSATWPEIYTMRLAQDKGALNQYAAFGPQHFAVCTCWLSFLVCAVVALTTLATLCQLGGS